MLMIAALLGAAACSRRSPTETRRTPDSPAPPEFSERDALSQLLPDAGHPRWTVDPPDDVLTFDHGAVERYAKGVARFSFRRDGVSRLVFLYETAPAQNNDCPACGVTIGAAVFSVRNGAWHVELATPELTLYRSGGRSPDPSDISLVRIGRERYAIRDTSCDMRAGRDVCVLALHEIAAGFAGIFSVVISSDNEGTCSDEPGQWHDGIEPCETSGATLSFTPGTNADYNDIVLAVRGTKGNEQAGRIEPFARKDRYAFRDGRYQRIPG
jgi:hypothetical protein